MLDFNKLLTIRMKKIKVENNIKIAETLPSEFYKSDIHFDQLKEKVFLE